MSPSSQGIYIIDSEISIVLMAMKRGNLWNSNSHQDTNTENLIKELMTLKKSLTIITDFKNINTVEFLMPFLDVIRYRQYKCIVLCLIFEAPSQHLLQNVTFIPVRILLSEGSFYTQCLLCCYTEAAIMVAV